MWRKALTVALAVLLAILSAGAVLADAPAMAMAGQESANELGSQRQITLSAAATNGSGWRLEATVLARGSGRVRRAGGIRGQSNAVLSGRFTLSHAGSATIAGDVTGTMNSDGTGQMHLAGDDGETDLDATLAANEPAGNAGSSTANVTLDVSGQLPAVAQQAPADGNAATSHFFWYLARATGLTAYLLLALNVGLGLMVRTRALDRIVARWRAFDLHQFTALLALGFVLLHVFSLLGDIYYRFSLFQLLVPFASPYRAVWVALGAIALYAMAGIIASFFLRRWIGYRTWRAIHYLTFGVFILSLIHGLLSGTDSAQIWAMGLYWSTGLAVAALTLRRFAETKRPRPAPALPIPRLREPA